MGGGADWAYVWKRTEKRLSGSHRKETGTLSAERRGCLRLHFEGARRFES